MKHWGFLILVLAIGYFLGVYQPSYGQKAISAVGL
jgi:hypothetical protein